MMKTCRLIFCLSLLTGPLSAADGYVPGKAVDGDFESFAYDFLEMNCIDCHDRSLKKGGLNLEELGPVDETNAAVWKSIWAQVALQQMPPKDEFQPKAIERLQFTDWIVGQLEETMKDKGGFHAHKDPLKGNFIDHNLIFGTLPDGIDLQPTSSPRRIWRVTPSEHITRLNELINTEPEYDPEKPGMRTRGDAVSINHGGELKLYFGVDRITSWAGGTVAYATAVKSVPVVLSSARDHGFDNYADFSTVNSAEATQTINKAVDILKYMAYGPGSLISFPEQITDDKRVYDKAKPPGDIRGLPSAITYRTKVVRPLTPVYDLLKEPGKEFTDDGLREAIRHLFEMLTFRPPTAKETESYLVLVKDTIDKLGPEEGLFMGLSAIFLDRDALFRPELAEGAMNDKHGRAMLQDWELGLALNHTLSYLKPDDELRQAIVDGRMRTREDVKREITRMLDDDSLRKPRLLQFFRDYFDYDHAGYICKDEKALADTSVSLKGPGFYKSLFTASASMDRLVELVLEEDQEVLKTLLTTRKVVAAPSDNILFGQQAPSGELRRNSTIRKQIKQEEQEIARLNQEKGELAVKSREGEFNKEAREKMRGRLRDLDELLEEHKRKRSQLTREANSITHRAKLNGPRTFARVGHMSFGKASLKPERILATAPEGQRLGILTHPVWLVSQSDAMDNHAIHRGKWIRERLLGGGIPDVPITVDAQLPDEPNTTLRSRMRVTREEYCWSCHQKMDPLGMPFEMYNHAGLYRTLEQGKPVDTTGEIIDSGDPDLDGPVSDAIDMITKLAESERVEQVFVRHAFRFWMGRNETLHDRPVLRDAHRAYRESGGSMKALITSLVTSDAFLYRQ